MYSSTQLLSECWRLCKLIETKQHYVGQVIDVDVNYAVII